MPKHDACSVSQPSQAQVALLRGINVGGKNKLPMALLSQMFLDEGCTDVRTYIQSGNVIFRSSEEVRAGLAGRIAERIKEQAGLAVPVVMRTRDELEAAALGNPYVADDTDPATLLVMFLADEPTPEQLAELDPERSPGDSYTVVDRQIYVHCPKGLADTKLTNDYFDRRLQTVSTGRNWRTVLKLLEMAQA